MDASGFCPPRAAFRIGSPAASPLKQIAPFCIDSKSFCLVFCCIFCFLERSRVSDSIDFYANCYVLHYLKYKLLHSALISPRSDWELDAQWLTKTPKANRSVLHRFGGNSLRSALNSFMGKLLRSALNMQQIEIAAFCYDLQQIAAFCIDLKANCSVLHWFWSKLQHYASNLIQIVTFCVD